MGGGVKEGGERLVKRRQTPDSFTLETSVQNNIKEGICGDACS